MKYSLSLVALVVTFHLFLHALPREGNVTVSSNQVQCFSEIGLIDHYYHFFFNCLIPIILHSKSHPGEGVVLCDSNIGPHMAAILTSVMNRKVVVVRDCKGPRVRLKGFDGNLGRDVTKITPSNRFDVLAHMRSLLGDDPLSGHIKVLLIGRLSGQKKRIMELGDASGAQRRSIRNFQLVERVLQEHFGEDLVTTYMEDHTILEQFAFFQGAEVIVAQHGAALANTFFVDNRTTKGLIEISPYSKIFYKWEVYPFTSGLFQIYC